MDLDWYVRRLSMMGPREMAGRARDKARQATLKTLRTRMEPSKATPVAFPHPVMRMDTSAVEPQVKEAVAAADRILDGRWPVLGVERTDMMPAPNWFIDPVSGIETPADMYSFSIEHRDPKAVGSIKQVWEPSRHHHLTVLAGAYAATGDDRYAAAAAHHLRDWWEKNPFLLGPHWTSGIEIGIRLISWIWTRRLLAGWRGVEDLFDRNPEFARHLYHHQWFLATFPSRGSSANNHLVAEAAGLFAASVAFPWFEESVRWERSARTTLEREIEAQTFPSGLNRELASEYHGLVFELFSVAAAEGDAAGRSLSADYWSTLRRMSDALAAVLDAALAPPRQGDADDGHGLLLDAPEHARWSGLVSLGATMFGDPGWYPPSDPTLLAVHVAALTRPPVLEGPRPETRPAVFPEAGMAVLRSAPDAGPEIWCRFDAGPHGYLSIAAHGHSDALSVEVRHDGVEILADPGTFSYHGLPEWRAYFRSTRAHNTLEVDGEDQSVPAGPFMWSAQARSRLEVQPGPDGVSSCSGSHDGYERLDPPVRHRRRVELAERSLSITDEVTSPATRPVRMSFHLGPEVGCTLEGSEARLSWPTGSAVLRLPDVLTWESHRGSTSPVAGWHSPAFGLKVPAVTLWGTGTVTGERTLASMLEFASAGGGGEPAEITRNTGSETGDPRYIARVGTIKERE